MKDRISFYDAAKGVLILLMLIGHIWTEGWFRTFIYAFHMPAFFIVSGMLFRHSSTLEKPLWRIVWKKIRTLLVPYFFFEAFSVLETVIRKGPELNVKGYLYQILTLRLTNGPLWFLIVLFCGELLFILLWKLKRPAVLAGFGVVLLALTFVLPKDTNYISPAMIAVGTLFLVVGYFAQPLLEKPALWLGAAAGAATAVIAALNPTDIASFQDGIPGLFLVSGFTGSLFVLQISRFLTWKPLTFLGKNSLIILGTHYPLYRAALWLFSIKTVSLPVGLAILAGLLAVEIPIIYLIDRCLPFVVGRWYPTKKTQAQSAE